MVQAVDVHAGLDAGDGFWPFRRHLLIFLAGILFFMGFDLLDGKLINGDADDLMRAVQVRTFIDIGNWFDMSLPSVMMPEIYVSPWSRLVDLPYALISGMLRPPIGQERALWLAFHAWPPVMGMFYGLFVIAILKRIAPRERDLPVSALLGIVIFSTYAIWEFSPGRIDHHNVQILLMLGMIYGISRWDAPGGLMSGAAISTAVAVGLETLPLIATCLVALAASWGLGAKNSARVLQAVGLAISVATVALMAALIPPTEYFTFRSDSFSAPYAMALFGFGALALVMPALIQNEGRRVQGGLAFAGLGLAILMAISWRYPVLADGPFPMINGLAETYWFDRIHQEMPVTLLFRSGDYRAIALLSLMLATLVMAIPAAWSEAYSGRAALPVIATIAVAAVGLTLFSNRTLRLAVAIVPLLVPAAITVAREAAMARAERPLATATLGTALAAVVGGLFSMFLVVPRGLPDFDAYDFLLMNDCKAADYSAFDNLGTARILAPPALGLQIISRGFDGVSVSTIPFHRASPGINGLLASYRAGTPAEREEGLRDFDHLAICKSPSRLAGEDELPLFADLMAGRPVQGLVPLTAAGELLLFRIDHAAMK